MTTLLSDERLAEIRAREQAATPGPWKDYVEHGFNGWKSYATGSYKLESTSPEVAPYQVALVEGYSRGEPTTRRQRKLDAAFIAAARQDVPDLLAEVERLRARVARLEGVLREVEWSGDTGDDRWNSCPYCEGHQPDHAPDCALDAALRTKEATDDDATE